MPKQNSPRLVTYLLLSVCGLSIALVHLGWRTHTLFKKVTTLDKSLTAVTRKISLQPPTGQWQEATVQSGGLYNFSITLPPSYSMQKTSVTEQGSIIFLVVPEGDEKERIGLESVLTIGFDPFTGKVEFSPHRGTEWDMSYRDRALRSFSAIKT